MTSIWRIVSVIPAAGVCLGLVGLSFGCSNILETKLMSSKSIFFAPGSAKTLYVQTHNISENQQVSLSELPHRLTAKGYRLVETPEQARFVLQSKVVYCNVTNPEVTFETVLAAGFGAGIGSLAPNAANPGIGVSAQSGVPPGMPPGMPNMAAMMEQVRMEQMRMAGMNSPQPDKTVLYFCAADVQITEHGNTGATPLAPAVAGVPPKPEIPVRQMRVVAGVRQKKLNVDEATPLLRDKLTTGVAGIF